MAGETFVTIIGNLTDSPTLRFTNGGDAVASFTVASTPRAFDKQTGGYRDGEAMFVRCSIWRQPAEHAVESLEKGSRVVVYGRLRSRSYETREGEKRNILEVEVEEIGPSLRYAVAKVANQRDRDAGQNFTRPSTQGGDPWPQRDQAPF